MKKQAYTRIAKIPFQFSTGKATLPAGEYKVTSFNPDGRVVLIRSAALLER